MKKLIVIKVILLIALVAFMASCSSTKPTQKYIVKLQGEVLFMYPQKTHTKTVVLQSIVEGECLYIYEVPYFANACELSVMEVYHIKGNRYEWIK
jgi:hypothetical protein